MAIGRFRDDGGIRRIHRLTLGSLNPSHSGPTNFIHTRGCHIFRVTDFEFAVDIRVVCHGVVFTSNTIVDVIAKLVPFCVGGVA
jgi:hypothetical protein